MYHHVQSIVIVATPTTRQGRRKILVCYCITDCSSPHWTRMYVRVHVSYSSWNMQTWTNTLKISFNSLCLSHFEDKNIKDLDNSVTTYISNFSLFSVKKSGLQYNSELVTTLLKACIRSGAATRPFSHQMQDLPTRSASVGSNSLSFIVNSCSSDTVAQYWSHVDYDGVTDYIFQAWEYCTCYWLIY